MAETYIEKFLKRGAPTVSHEVVKSVSDFRRGVLEDEVASGKFAEKGNTGNSSYLSNKGGNVGNVLGSRIKKASYDSTSTGASSGGWRGSGGTLQQIPEIYSPLWLTSNLNLPRDRATINAWSRAFFALNGMIQNAITLHSTYPISKLNISCKDPKIEEIFGDMIEKIDLMTICSQIAQEYFVIGEAFPYAELDDSTGTWSRIILQNPDYVIVKHSVLAGEPILSLRPDENLKRIIMSNKPSDVQQRQRLHPAVLEHVKKGENIPLNNLYAHPIIRKLNPYEIRGTGLITCCFRSLMLYDKLTEAKFAQADSLINPLTLVKIGSEKHMPEQADLEGWREVFEHAAYDKNFKIFTHGEVTVEPIGWGSAVMDTSADYERLRKEIYMGLMIPQVLMDGGGDVTYANGGVTLDVLKQRYLQFRNILTYWIKSKIFAPIAQIHDMYERRNGEKRLVIPEVEWNHMSLFDAGDHINTLIQWRGSDGGEDGGVPAVSRHSIYRSLGLDAENEKRKAKIEIIEDIIFEKEKAALKKYSLAELYTLGPDDSIEEKDEGPLPGEEVEGEEGMGGFDMGLPGMSPPPGGGGLGGGLPEMEAPPEPAAPAPESA